MTAENDACRPDAERSVKGKTLPETCNKLHPENDADREAFEAWLFPQCHKDTAPLWNERWGTSYAHPVTRGAWEGWQAALAHARQPGEPVAWALRLTDIQWLKKRTAATGATLKGRERDAFLALMRFAEDALSAAHLAQPAPVAVPEDDVLLALPCDEQHRLATMLAGNVGYELVEEPEHPDSPHRSGVPAGYAMVPRNPSYKQLCKMGHEWACNAEEAAETYGTMLDVCGKTAPSPASPEKGEDLRGLESITRPLQKIEVKLSPAEAERVSSNLSAEFGPEFVRPLQDFALASYSEIDAVLRSRHATHPTAPKPAEFMSDKTRAFVEPVRRMLAEGINVQATGEATNQIVEGAFRSLVEHIDELEMDLAALRTAVALAPKPAEVRVKGLEFPPRCPRGQRVHSRPQALIRYTIAHHGGDDNSTVYQWASEGGHWSEPHHTYEAAMGCAQADYEQRILSALEPSPAPAAEEFRRGAEAMRESIADVYHRCGDTFTGDNISSWPIPLTSGEG